MLRKHFDGTVAATPTRQASGFLESRNGWLQAATRRVRRYANLEPVLFMITGKLIVALINQSAE